jgi:hypothetical protein
VYLIINNTPVSGGGGVGSDSDIRTRDRGSGRKLTWEGMMSVGGGGGGTESSEHGMNSSEHQKHQEVVVDKLG